MSALRAVFLDVDDTLVDFDRAARAALVATLGVDADYDLWRTLEHFRRYESGELDFQSMLDLRMADFLAMIGRAADVPSAAHFEARRFERLPQHYTLYDDVLPCLAALRGRGLLLGLITNNVASHQRDKITAVGLGDTFDTVVISGEVGVAKPNRAIFEHACATLSVPAHEAMHVGDNLRTDARGARDAGLRAVWLDRRGGVPGGRESAAELGVAVINGLVQLADLVA
jgi:putative hydrolase of the HAD superfamily